MDSGVKGILRGMDAGSDFYQFAICLEGRLNLSVPKMEDLFRGF